MRLDGVKSFKADEVSGGVSQGQEAQLQQEAIEDFFVGPDVTGQASYDANTNADPIDDYTYGLIKAGTVQSNETMGVEGWLESFPPSLEEVVANNENAINYLDLVAARYEKAKNDLYKLQSAYEAEIASGQAAASRLAELTRCLDLIGGALSRCDVELKKVSEQTTRQEGIYLDEMRSMKDLNCDSWVGRPYANGSYYVKVDEATGETIYYDPKTRRAVPNPMMDPDGESRLTSNDALRMISADEAMASPDGSTYDMYLKLSEEALKSFSADNIYSCPIDLGIPEYIWVARNGDGEGADPYKTKYDENGGESMEMAAWSNDGGLHQAVPEDRSAFMQVQVTGVKVLSEDSGLTDAEGNRLYHTVVELYSGEIDGGRCIGRIRVEGFESSSGNPAATETSSGTSYVAASSVGFSINGDGRASPLQVNAEQYVSTGRHIVDEGTWSTMGLERPGDDGKGDEAYDENVGAFSDNDSDFGYDGMHDAYCPEGTRTEDGETLLREPTGIFVRGLRGDIVGTGANDIIWTTGVNEFNSYAKERLPENAKPTMNGDPFFSNRVDAKSGNNVIVAGGGDNYLFNGTLVWAKNNARGGENYITTPDIDIDQKSKNPRCFVRAEGGKTYLYNPIEQDLKQMGDINDPNADPEWAYKKYVTDDYFDIRGAFEAMNPADEDLVRQPTNSTPCGEIDFWLATASDAMSGFLDELTKLPESDADTASQLNWDEINGQKTVLDDEMNGFFDEMFGEAGAVENETASMTDQGE